MLNLDALLGDLRHGLRTLRHDRGFTVTALLTFALCLGANVALFAIVDAVLLRPLPFPHPEQLVTVCNSYPKAGVDRAGSSVVHYLERRERIAAFAETGAYKGVDATIGETGSTEHVAGLSVTPSFFRVLGVAPALGRIFDETEGMVGHEHVVVLSDALWRERFAADPHVVGRTLRMTGGVVSTIVGVMPADFQFLSSHARLWVPMVFSDDDRKPEQRHSNNITVIARLRPDATVATAQVQIDALNQATTAIDPYASLVAQAGFTTKVTDLHTDHVAQTRTLVLLLQAGVLLLLGIGMVNITNLLLVRTTARAKERSIRQVLGATPTQLARETLAETLVLAVVGGVLGLAVGWGGLRLLGTLGAERLPHAGALTLDPVVCAVSLVGAVLVGLLLALPVLWHTRQQNLSAALSVESRGGTTSRATHRLRHALIVAQFALAFVLLVSAGLLGLSFARVLQVNPGFQPEHVLTATLSLPQTRYAEKEQRVAFIGRLAHELAASPGLVAVGFGTSMPFGGGTDINAVTVEGYTPAPGDTLKAHYMGGVTGEFFSALGIPLREGRWLTADDTAHATNVCVVDEIVARHYWPNGSALGKRLYNGVIEKGKEPYTVVGIVGPIKQEDLAETRANGAVYLPYAQYPGGSIAVLMRTQQEPGAAAPLFRAAVARVDPDLSVSEIKPLNARIDETLQQRRSSLVLACLFSGLALLLVTIGLYGVLAYTVSQRRREIGVRMALGAQPADIRTQFLSLAGRLVLVGTVLGGLAAWWSTKAMATLLYGVSAGQPVVYGVTLGVLVAVAFVASLIPAMRATRVPPMEALRSD